MDKVAIIVPVSVNEPEEILRESAEHLKSLGDFKILYVFDGNESDKRVQMLRKMGCEVLARNSKRGKRAGAINDAIAHLKIIPDFIAIFDVDSHPSKDFITNCVRCLKKDGKAYIASTKRAVSNPVNMLTKTVEFEYKLINFLLRISKFKQFNGLIGVLNGKILAREKLREDAITEDADFATRMHARGYRALLCEGILEEQAPLYWRDFYNQRKRWYYGGLQLWRYLKDVLACRDLSFKISWLTSLTLTYFPVLFLPLIVLSIFPLLIYKKRDAFKLYVGLIIYCIVLQIASLSAIVKHVKGDEVEWVAIKRS